MYYKIYENPDIYRIDIPLPNNPLKNLNCYVVKTKEKNLIIDTGFNMPECYKALKEGLDELEVDIDKTDMFVTHLHSDHTGLVSDIMNEDSVIYMSKTDHEYVKLILESFWLKSDKSYLMEGFTEPQLDYLKNTNPAKVYNPSRLFQASIVGDNSKFRIGRHEFRCISTPGHTPGHMCLYLESEKILFTGDHILFDISPNITRWPSSKNSLQDYLNSLEKIKKLKINLALPAHRKNDMDIYERIDQLINHHEVRLKEVTDIVKDSPGINAYDTAGRMRWSMKGKSWEDAPLQQKWFAVGEVLAHLDYLEEERKVFKRLEDGIFRYFAQ